MSHIEGHKSKAADAFGGIAHLKPAHHDHTHKSHDGKEYEHGGPEGFNHQDGGGPGDGGEMHTGGKDTVHGHERGRGHTRSTHPHTPGPMGGGTKHAETEGGVDFTVPPYKK